VFTSVTALGFLYAAALTVALASQESAIRPFIRAGRAGAAVAAIAFAALGLRLLAADAMLAAARTRLLAGDLAGSMERFEAYRRWNTPGSAADLWFARTLISRLESAADPLTRLESAAAAGTAALRATRTSENPADAWYTLAAFYALQDDARRSEECLRAAIAASPNWFKPHWVLARLLERQGRAAEAAREAATAVDLDGGKHPEVKASTESIRRSTLQPQFNE